MTNHTIAAALDRIAELLDLEAEDAEVTAAYRRAAKLIRLALRPVRLMVEDDGLEALHALGLGWVLAGLVTDWLRTGQLPLLERLERKHAPEHRLQCVPGIGPRLAHEVHTTLGVESPDELATAAQAGRLSNVCGFGPRRVALVKAMLARPRRPLRRPVQLELIDAD